MNPSPVTRRELIRTVGIGGVVGLAGCQALPWPPQTQDSATKHRGRVTTPDGNPVADATVLALHRNSRQSAKSTTNSNGQFTIAIDRPCWLQVSHPAYVTQTEAIAPDIPTQVTLTPEANTVTLRFGGDVMFGRRFYDPSPDALNPTFQIDPRERLADHKTILSYTEPLLQQADVTSVNLESPLTTAKWRYPDKEFVFTSHPVAAQALKDSGVDYVALGNNHVFDALRPGLVDTRDTLRAADIAYSGAGLSSEEAWSPVIFERKGVTIAFISCTSVVGAQYSIDWSADRTQSETHTVTQNGQSLTFSDGIGVAEATEERLAAKINQARDTADIVVVQIHGGSEYQRTPTSTLRRLVDAASTAGADLVVNHHPHVTGGLEVQNSTLVAWSLGNFVFDQVLWETLTSYLLTVHVTTDGVERAMINPLLMEGYVPKGVVGQPDKQINWRTAGLSTEPISLLTNGLDYSASPRAETDRETRTLEGSGDIYVRESGWVSSILNQSGTTLLGRDRLRTGRFENDDIDDELFEAPLWRFKRDQFSSGASLGVNETGGVRLVSRAENTRRTVLTPASRIPIENPFTLTGAYRTNASAGVDIMLAWYDAPSGNSFAQEILTLTDANGKWTRSQYRFQPPDNATYCNFFIYVSPPSSGDARELLIDDLSLIEWAAESVTAGRQYDHLYVDGSATVELSTSTRGSSEASISWRQIEE